MKLLQKTQHSASVCGLWSGFFLVWEMSSWCTRVWVLSSRHLVLASLTCASSRLAIQASATWWANEHQSASQKSGKTRTRRKVQTLRKTARSNVSEQKKEARKHTLTSVSERAAVIWNRRVEGQDGWGFEYRNITNVETTTLILIVSLPSQPAYNSSASLVLGGRSSKKQVGGWGLGGVGIEKNATTGKRRMWGISTTQKSSAPKLQLETYIKREHNSVATPINKNNLFFGLKMLTSVL